MIGDLILFLKKWWKQNITCVHDYRHREIDIISCDVCTKCGKVKNYIDLR